MHVVISKIVQSGSFQFRYVEKLEGDSLKLMVLGANFLTSFVLIMISLSKHTKGSGSDITDEAVASLGVFIGVGLLYILSVVCILNSKTETSQTVRRKHRQNISIALGGLCYYIGDNLPPLIREYQKVLCGEDQERVDIVQLLGICMLAIATAIYAPVLVDGALPPNKEKGEIVHTRKSKQDHSQKNRSKRLYSCSQENRLHQKKKTQFTWLFCYYWQRQQIWIWCTQLSRDLYPTNALKRLLVLCGHSLQPISFSSSVFVCIDCGTVKMKLEQTRRLKGACRLRETREVAVHVYVPQLSLHFSFLHLQHSLF